MTMPSPNDYLPNAATATIIEDIQKDIEELKRAMAEMTNWYPKIRDLVQDSIIAIEKKIGVDGSTDTTSIDYKTANLEQEVAQLQSEVMQAQKSANWVQTEFEGLQKNVEAITAKMSDPGYNG